jgi:hypothetical protein
MKVRRTLITTLSTENIRFAVSIAISEDRGCTIKLSKGVTEGTIQLPDNELEWNEFKDLLLRVEKELPWNTDAPVT